jgi:transposase
MSSPQDEHGRAAGSAPASADDLSKKVAQLTTAMGRAMSRIQKLETELNDARAQVAWFHRQIFGQKSDRIRPEDLQSAWLAYQKEQEAKARGLQPLTSPSLTDLPSVQFLLDFIEVRAPESPSGPVDAPAPAPAIGDGAELPPVPPKPRGHGRKRVPPTLREETIVIQPDHIPEGANQVGAEVSYRVGIRRAEMVRYAIVRPKYEIEDEASATTAIVVAEPPHEMIPKGLLTPSGLAHVIASKWDRHVPYNRLARFFEGAGYRLSVSTLSGVAIRSAPLAKDLVDVMTAHAKAMAAYLAIDATGVLLQQPEVCLHGHVWVRYIEGVCVLVSFSRKHDSDAAGTQLDGWNCPTLADGAQVYDRKQRETGNSRGGCWSHGRRRLVFAAPTDARALVGVKLMNDLFAIERELVDSSPEHRLAERKLRSAPIVAELFAWRDELLSKGKLGRSLLAKALRYLRNQADRLEYFLSDGCIPIHNNLAELQARHLAVGRKNWLFLGSEAAADAGSVWLSLILSARMHNLGVEDYLRDLFRVLPDWPKPRLLELAPHNWMRTQRRLSPLQMCRELGPITIPPPLES